MKKMSNWAAAGIFIGAMFAIGNFWRYYVQYRDLSAMVIGVLIGLLIIAVSWLYDSQLKHSHAIEVLENWVDDNDWHNTNQPIASGGVETPPSQS